MGSSSIYVRNDTVLTFDQMPSAPIRMSPSKRRPSSRTAVTTFLPLFWHTDCSSNPHTPLQRIPSVPTVIYNQYHISAQRSCQSWHRPNPSDQHTEKLPNFFSMEPLELMTVTRCTSHNMRQPGPASGPRPAAHLLVVDDVAVVGQHAAALHLLCLLCQLLLEHHAADDAGDRQAQVHRGVEGVELDIPAQHETGQGQLVLLLDRVSCRMSRVAPKSRG